MATSPLSLLPRGHAAGFDQPFEMLAACHERVERMLGLLERLAAHVHTHGVDDQAAQAAQDVCRYFDLAGPAHHEDEERHVLPRLQALADPTLARLARQLHDDHRAMSTAWARLRPDLVALAAHQRPATWHDLAAGPPPAWRAFCAHYRTHLAAEDRVAYPAVQPGLGAADRQAMGQEMAGRRGVPGPGPAPAGSPRDTPPS